MRAPAVEAEPAVNLDEERVREACERFHFALLDLAAVVAAHAADTVRAARAERCNEPQPTAKAQKCWKVAELALELGVPYNTLLRLIDKGHGPLKARKVGRHWIIADDAVTQFLTSQ